MSERRRSAHMPKREKEPEIITFKADPSLAAALGVVRNRSEFIRNALLAALENTCPLCHGKGMLTANQKEHLSAFLANHGVEECGDCHEAHLVCPTRPEAPVHKDGHVHGPDCNYGHDHAGAATVAKGRRK